MSKGEIANWERLFREWQSPNEMQELLNQLDQLASDLLVTSTRSQFWRDGFIASAFAITRGSTMLRLLPPTTQANGKRLPDCEIEIGSRTFRYELTEADKADRRRGDEYRAWKQHQVESDRVPDARELSAIIRSAVARKVAKAASYERVDGLLVLLNTWDLSADGELRNFARNAVSGLDQAFPELWLLTGKELQQLW